MLIYYLKSSFDNIIVTMVPDKNPFKTERSFEQRCSETKAILPKYPTKCPIVVQRYYKETAIDAIDQNKFLVPIDMTVHGLMYIIRKRLNIQNESIAMYLFTEKGNIFATNSNISYVYDKFKDEDGYLYLFYNSENTFG